MTKPRKKREPASGFDPAALDALLGERRTLGEVDELFRQMKKALMERALAGELTHHLGYAAGEAKPTEQPNHRNGTTPKTVLTEDGAIPLPSRAIGPARSRRNWCRRTCAACRASPGGWTFS